MQYCVSEAAKILGVSKTTIHNKISEIKELKKHIKKNGKLVFISEGGLELVRQSLCKNTRNNLQKETNQTDETVDDNAVQDINKVSEILINSLQNQIKDLKTDKKRLYKLFIKQGLQLTYIKNVLQNKGQAEIHLLKNYVVQEPGQDEHKIGFLEKILTNLLVLVKK